MQKRESELPAFFFQATVVVHDAENRFDFVQGREFVIGNDMRGQDLVGRERLENDCRTIPPCRGWARL